MYKSNRKQFIFKQSTGKLWNFFVDEKSRLTYSTLTKRNTWTDPLPIMENAHQSYSACMDAEDRFHFVHQDNQGNINYSLLKDSKVETIPLLISKTPTAYEKYFEIISLHGNIHVFYVLQNENGLFLAHQTISNGKPSSPKVIDYVKDNIHPYCITFDRDNNIHAFYQVSDGKNLQIGYKKYISQQKFWSEFTAVTHHSGHCSYPKALTDKQNIIHLVYQRAVGKEFEFVYQQKIPERNIWSNEAVLHSSIYKFDELSIALYEGEVYAFWIRNDIIYFSKSTDEGFTWQKPARYNFPSARQLVCLNYKTNDPFESSRIVVREIPGSFINGIKLAFIRNDSNEKKAFTADELKNMIIDSLKLLEASVDELKSSDSDTKDTLIKTSYTLQNYEKELTKLSVKLNVLEKQIAQQKQAMDKYENSKKSVPDDDYLNNEIEDLKQSIILQMLHSSEIMKIKEDIEAIRSKTDNAKPPEDAETE